MSRSLLVVSILFSFAFVAAPAQTHPIPTKATDISNEEVDQVLKKSLPRQDQQLKVVDVGQYNLGIGIIHRAAAKDRTDGTTPCLAHHQMTETYIIRSGGGMLVTGGTVFNSKEVAASDDINIEAVGPSASGFVRNSDAQVRQVKPGDIIIIPADVCHGWFGISDHVDYLSLRPDPGRILPAGYINPALKSKF